MTTPSSFKLTSENDLKKNHFKTALNKLLFYGKSFDARQALEAKVYDAILQLINHVSVSPESKKSNSEFVVGHFKGALRQHKNVKAIVSVFEKTYFWLDLDDKQKQNMSNFLESFHIKCSDKCRAHFLPAPKKTQRELLDEMFESVSGNPKMSNVLMYSKNILRHNAKSYQNLEKILILLKKVKPKENRIFEQTLFGQAPEAIDSNYKHIVKQILELYKNSAGNTDVNRSFLANTIMSTNFNDAEIFKLQEDFPDYAKTVATAFECKRNNTIGMLNKYVLKGQNQEPGWEMLTYRSLYVSLLYQSLVEGKDIDAVNLEDLHVLQKRNLAMKMLPLYKEAFKDKNGSEMHPKHAFNGVHKMVARLDSQKIDALDEYIKKTPFIDDRTQDFFQMQKLLQTLRGDEKSLHYSIKAINRFEL